MPNTLQQHTDPESPAHHTPARLIVAAFGILALFFAVWAARWGWADFTTIPARAALERWDEEGEIGSTDEWERMRERLETARVLDRHNADHLADLARLYEWQALQYPQWEPQAHDARKQAIDYYRQALAERPTWGYIWIHLAYSKILNSELDGEAIAAIDKALVLAPWEKGVQLKATWIALTLDHRLPPDTRDALDRNLERSMRYNFREVIDMAVDIGQEERIVQMVTTLPQHEAFAAAVMRLAAESQ